MPLAWAEVVEATPVPAEVGQTSGEEVIHISVAQEERPHRAAPGQSKDSKYLRTKTTCSTHNGKQRMLF